MAVWGVQALNQAGVGPSAGIGSILPFFQNYYQDNFEPVEQGLSDIFSDRDAWIKPIMNQVRQSGLAAGQSGNAITQRDISRYGMGLDARQQAQLGSTASENLALSEVNAANRALPALDEGFYAGQKAFAGLGADLSGMIIGNDVSLQGFDIARQVGAMSAQQKQAIQKYLADTAIAQARLDFRGDISDARDKRNSQILGDISSSVASNFEWD